MTAPSEAISSSIWTNVPPTAGSARAMCSAISDDGVIGYPAKNRQPAASAPSAHAWFPWMSLASVTRPLRWW